MSIIWRRPHRRYRIEFGVDESANEFFLRINGCVRKTRSIVYGRPNYVWTNIEMEWEEHRYLEGWLERTDTGYDLRVTENGVSIVDELVEESA